MPEFKAKIKEVEGLVIFAVFVVLTGFICSYFDIKIALAAFMSSLFFIYVIPASKYSSAKNIIGSYVIASLFGFLLPRYFSMLPEVLMIALIVFISGFLMILLSMEHPPAMAIVVFFLLTDLTKMRLIGFFICFVLLIVIEIVMLWWKKKKGITEEVPEKMPEIKEEMPSFGKEEMPKFEEKMPDFGKGLGKI